MTDAPPSLGKDLLGLENTSAEQILSIAEVAAFLAETAASLAVTFETQTNHA